MKKPPKKSQQRHPRNNLAEGQSRLPKQPGENCQAQRTQGHEAVFDFAPGQITRGEAAESDSNRQPGHDVAGADLTKLEHIFSVIDHALLQQLRDKPEIHVAQTRQPKHTVFAHQLNLLPKVAQEIGPESPARVGSGHAGNSERKAQSDKREKNEHNAGPRLASFELLIEQRT